MATLKYTTASGLTDLLSEELQGEFTDDSGFGEPVIDTDRIEQYLAVAESVVESYVANRYVLPLSPIPLSLSNAVYVIAKFRLSVRRGFVTEDIRTDYDDVREWLMMIRNGELDLPEVGISSDEVQTGFADVSNMKFDRNVFQLPDNTD